MALTPADIAIRRKHLADMIAAGNWQGVQDYANRTDLSHDPDEQQIVDEAKHAMAFDSPAAQQKKAVAEYEKKLSYGPAPKAAPAEDVYNRLKRMGVPHDKISEAAAAYHNLIDAYGRYPDLTRDELKTEMKSRGYADAQIEAMEPFFETVRPIVQADLGISNPTTNFPDETSRRNYLIANHFTPDEVDKALSHWTPQNNEYQRKAKIFPIPDVAKERINVQNVKHQAGRVKRSAEYQNKKAIQDVVQNYTENTMPGTSREKHAMEVGAAGSHLLAHAANQGAFKYGGKRLADKTADELAAEALTRQINPNSASEQARQKTLQDITSRNFGKDAAQKAAEPYMSKASADFAKRHREMFGDIENEHEQSLIDKMTKNYLEKIAPSVQAKYMTPGVRGHGHIAKESAEFLNQAQEGTARAINETRAANRRASMDATLQEQANQAKLAAQAGALSGQDIESDLKGVNALEGIHARDEAAKLQHAARIGAIGENEQERQQKLINEKIREAEAEHGHAERIGKVLVDASNANPVSQLKEPEHLEKPKRTGINSTAAGFMGAGANMLGGLGKEKMAKRGGRIMRATGGTVTPLAHSKYVTPHAMIGYLQAKSSHQRLATGGPVDPSFIQDAVFDGVLPSTELRQQVRRKVLNQAKDDYDTKSRNHLAVGGPVNPILEGAALAKNFVENDRDKEIKDKVHSERMKIMNPTPEPEESLFSRGLKGFMAGAASTGNNDWVARSGRAFTAASSADSAAKQARREREKEHQKLLLDIGKQYADERNVEKTHGLAERKQAHDELMGESTQKYHKAHSDLLNAQAEKLRAGFGLNGENPGDVEDQPTKPQTKESEKRIDKAQELMKAADIASNHLDNLENDVLSSKTGKAAAVLSDIPSLGFGNWAASKLAGNDTATMGSFDSDSDEAVSSILNMERVSGEVGGKQIAAIGNAAIKGKPNKYLEQSKNIQKTLVYRGQILANKQHARDVARQKGAPLSVLREMDEKIKREHDKIAALSQYKPTPHNDTYATPATATPVPVQNQAKIAALAAKKAEAQAKLDRISKKVA
jgi:hypothetical protein